RTSCAGASRKWRTASSTRVGAGARSVKSHSTGASTARPTSAVASASGMVCPRASTVRYAAEPMAASNPILWRPPPERIASCDLTRFARFAADRYGAPAVEPGSERGYRVLHDWSVRERGAFWAAVWDYTGVVGERGARTVLAGERMPGARWFPDARLNYAENLLAGPDDEVALIARDESGARSALTRADLRNAAGATAAAFAAAGIGPGDVVAGYVGNTVEAV